MRIDEIVINVKNRMDEQFQSLTIFGAKFWSSKVEKKLCKFVNFPNCKILEICSFFN